MEINRVSLKQRMSTLKKHPGSMVVFLLTIAAAVITVGVLGFLVIYVLVRGIPYLTPQLFAFTYTSDNVSMMPSIINTLLMTALTLLVAVPLGVFAAIYLVEYAKNGSRLIAVVRVMAETLTGIPSIVYGLFGMLFFVGYCKWDYSLLSGAMTLAIMVLPVIMRTTEEALMAVPKSFREGSFGLGAGKLRSVFVIVLPSAVPGILSGIIVATGTIVGEPAALIYTAGTMAKIPSNIFSSARTLSVHMYRLSNEGLHTDAAFATAVVLLLMVIGINALSNVLAGKFAKK